MMSTAEEVKAEMFGDNPTHRSPRWRAATRQAWAPHAPAGPTWLHPCRWCWTDHQSDRCRLQVHGLLAMAGPSGFPGARTCHPLPGVCVSRDPKQD